MKTKKPSIIGSPVSPERAAKLSAPTPRAAPSSVANILFKPFPRVPPEWKVRTIYNHKINFEVLAYGIKMPHKEVSLYVSYNHLKEFASLPTVDSKTKITVKIAHTPESLKKL